MDASQLTLPLADGDAAIRIDRGSGHHATPAYLTYAGATIDVVRAAFVRRYGREPDQVFERPPSLVLAGPVPGS